MSVLGISSRQTESVRVVGKGSGVGRTEETVCGSGVRGLGPWSVDPCRGYGLPDGVNKFDRFLFDGGLFWGDFRHRSRKRRRKDGGRLGHGGGSGTPLPTRVTKIS